MGFLTITKQLSELVLKLEVIIICIIASKFHTVQSESWISCDLRALVDFEQTEEGIIKAVV